VKTTKNSVVLAAAAIAVTLVQMVDPVAQQNANQSKKKRKNDKFLASAEDDIVICHSVAESTDVFIDLKKV
jgi:hypothetical protein